jgi:hypothetical protein
MSRLCRLKSYSTIGDDGVWAYNEITRLRAVVAGYESEPGWREMQMRIKFLESVVGERECEIERLTAELDAIKGALGCEDCKFFLARDSGSLTDPDVSEAAFKAVFHDVKEIQQWKTRKELEAERDMLVEALKRASVAMNILSDWTCEIEMPDGWGPTLDEVSRIDEALAKVKKP